MSSEDTKIFEERQTNNKKNRHSLDDDTIDSMQEYFKLEDREELLRYIKRRKSTPLDLAIS